MYNVIDLLFDSPMDDHIRLPDKRNMKLNQTCLCCWLLYHVI